MQHSFRKLLRKNLLYVTFPLVLILSALLLVVFQISRLEMFRTTALSDYTKVGDYYAAEQKNVTITVSNLKSLGFSRTDGEKKTAEYFYRIENGRLQLFVLSEASARRYRSNQMEHRPLTVRIEKDEVTAQYIEREYAQSLGFTSDDLEGFCSVYVLDETAYPRMRIVIVRVAVITFSVLLGLLMLYVILALSFPTLNYQAWTLKRFGHIGRYIRKIDREMDKKLRYHQDHVTVTENYLIMSYISRIDVVRIDDIKHVEKRKRGLRSIHVYRLTASNADDLYFEADFFEEDIINDVIYFMRGEPILEYEEQVMKEKEEEENRIAENMRELEKEAEEEEMAEEIAEEIAEEEAKGLFDDMNRS